MKKIYFNIVLATFFLGVAISPAQALMFRDLNWTDYDNDASYKSFAGGETGLGYDIHFQALGGNLTWNPSDGGVGVGDDEITGGREALLIWYSKPIDIATFELVDLFYEGTARNPYREAGFFGFGQPHCSVSAEGA